MKLNSNCANFYLGQENTSEPYAGLTEERGERILPAGSDNISLCCQGWLISPSLSVPTGLWALAPSEESQWCGGQSRAGRSDSLSVKIRRLLECEVWRRPAASRQPAMIWSAQPGSPQTNTMKLLQLCLMSAILTTSSSSLPRHPRLSGKLENCQNSVMLPASHLSSLN